MFRLIVDSLFKPKAHIDYIIKQDKTKESLILILIISVLAYFKESLSQGIGDAILGTLLFSFLFGFLVALVYVFVLSWWFNLIGKIFKGQATNSDMRFAMIWSLTPQLVDFVLKLTGYIFLPMTDPLIIKLFALIQMIIGIWSLILMTINISAAQKFNWIKSFISILIASLPFILLMILSWMRM